MHPELKAYLDEFEAKAQARYDASARLFAQHDALLSKIITGASTPQPARSAVVASDGGLTHDTLVPAVVPDVFSASSSTTKAQEVIAAPHGASLDSIDPTPMTCSMTGSTQVDAVANVDEAQDTATTVHPEHAVIINYTEVTQLIPVQAPLSIDIITSPTKAQEVFEVPYVPLDCITKTLVSSSTDCSNQIVATPSLSSTITAASLLLAAAARMLVTDLDQPVPDGDSIQSTPLAIERALLTTHTPPEVTIIHSPHMPMKRDMGIKQQGQLLHPMPWSSFAYHSESTYLEAAVGTFWFVPCPTRKLWCCWQYEHLQQWPPPVPVQIVVNNAALFHDTARGCVYADFGYVWWPPDHQLWMRNELRAWLTPNQHATGVVHLSHNVKNPGTLSANQSSQKDLQLTQFKQNQYSVDRATHIAEVQGIGSHLQNVIQLWAVDVSAGLSVAGVEEISWHGTFVIHTGYPISCMSRPCPWPSFDCFHEGAQLKYAWPQSQVTYGMNHYSGALNALTKSLRCRPSVHLKLRWSSFSSNNRVAPVWLELPRGELLAEYYSNVTNFASGVTISVLVVCSLESVEHQVPAAPEQITSMSVISSMQSSYEFHAQVQQASCGRQFSVSTELQTCDVTKLRPRPWPLFEFNQETIQLQLQWTSFSCNCRAVHVVSEQYMCTQLYLRIMSMSTHQQILIQAKSKGSGRFNLECRSEQLSSNSRVRLQLVVLTSFQYCSFKCRPDWILVVRPPTEQRTSEDKNSSVKTLSTYAHAHEFWFTGYIVCRCTLSKIMRSRGYTIQSFELYATFLPVEMDHRTNMDACDKWGCQHFISARTYQLLSDYVLEQSIPQVWKCLLYSNHRTPPAYVKTVDTSQASPWVHTILVDNSVHHGMVHRCEKLYSGGDQLTYEWRLLNPNFLQASIGSCSNAYFSENQYMVDVNLLVHSVGQLNDMVQKWSSQYHAEERHKFSQNCCIRFGIPLVGSGLLELELLIPQPGEHLPLLQPKPPWSPLAPPTITIEFSSNMRTNSEFLHLAGVLRKLTQFWAYVDHASTLSSCWWCFSWVLDAGLITNLFWLAHIIAEKLQEGMPCISESSTTCGGLHAMRSITEDYPTAFIVRGQFIQSVKPATSSCVQWDLGGFDFAELAENVDRLGGKPVVKEEGMSATQLSPRLHRPRHYHGSQSGKPTSSWAGLGWVPIEGKANYYK